MNVISVEIFFFFCGGGVGSVFFIVFLCVYWGDVYWFLFILCELYSIENKIMIWVSDFFFWDIFSLGCRSSDFVRKDVIFVLREIIIVILLNISVVCFSRLVLFLAFILIYCRGILRGRFCDYLCFVGEEVKSREVVESFTGT